MKPHLHAESSAKKFGGKSDDYLYIHQWFDATKAHFSDNRHRALRHHSQGIFEAESIFGITITNSDNKQVSVRDVGEQHVLEDLGFIPTVSDYLNHLTYQDWMSGDKKEIPLIDKGAMVYDGSSISKLNQLTFIDGLRTFTPLSVQAITD